MNLRAIGEEKENLAASELERRGYRILEKNFRCRLGEIDIIAKDGSTVVFVEVKYRCKAENGFPQEAVTFAKQRKLCRTADYYRYLHQMADNIPCRFDVVWILDGKVEVLQNAFWYDSRK